MLKRCLVVFALIGLFVLPALALDKVELLNKIARKDIEDVDLDNCFITIRIARLDSEDAVVDFLKIRVFLEELEAPDRIEAKETILDILVEKSIVEEP